MWIKCGKSNRLINMEHCSEITIEPKYDNSTNALYAVNHQTHEHIMLAESRSPEYLKKQMTSIIKALNSGCKLCRVYSDGEEE